MNEKRSCGWNLCHFHQSISVKNLLLMPLLSRAGYFSLFCSITSATFGYMSLKICGSSAQERAVKRRASSTCTVCFFSAFAPTSWQLPFRPFLWLPIFCDLWLQAVWRLSVCFGPLQICFSSLISLGSFTTRCAEISREDTSFLWTWTVKLLWMKTSSLCTVTKLQPRWQNL